MGVRALVLIAAAACLGVSTSAQATGFNWYGDNNDSYDHNWSFDWDWDFDWDKDHDGDRHDWYNHDWDWDWKCDPKPDCDDDERDCDDKPTVPTPGAATAGLALLGMMGLRRRRTA